MKKVRYAVGAVAAMAPVAVFAGPAAAQATAARPQAATTAKRVSHQPGPAYNWGKCTGTQSAYEGTSSQTEQFWYTPHGNSTCVGTVEGSYRQIGQEPYPTYFRVRIWYYDDIISSAYGTITPGHDGSGNFSGTTAFHQYYPNPVRVCAAWLTAHEGVIGSPVCITV
jgi:hypothetical protein